MGGAQTAYIGLNHTDKFSHIGIFSAGLPDFSRDYKELLDNPVETNKRLKYLFLGAGSQDKIGPGGSSIAGQRSIDSILTAKRIKHTFYVMPDAGHTWLAWRYYLGEKFLPGCFNSRLVGTQLLNSLDTSVKSSTTQIHGIGKGLV
jgi:enterochelin esterase-like enzyme